MLYYIFISTLSPTNPNYRARARARAQLDDAAAGQPFYRWDWRDGEQQSKSHPGPGGCGPAQNRPLFLAPLQCIARTQSAASPKEAQYWTAPGHYSGSVFIIICHLHRSYSTEYELRLCLLFSSHCPPICRRRQTDKPALFCPSQYAIRRLECIWLDRAFRLFCLCWNLP